MTEFLAFSIAILIICILFFTCMKLKKELKIKEDRIFILTRLIEQLTGNFNPAVKGAGKGIEKFEIAGRTCGIRGTGKTMSTKIEHEGGTDA